MVHARQRQPIRDDRSFGSDQSPLRPSNLWSWLEVANQPILNPAEKAYNVKSSNVCLARAPRNNVGCLIPLPGGHCARGALSKAFFLAFSEIWPNRLTLSSLHITLQIINYILENCIIIHIRTIRSSCDTCCRYNACEISVCR